ncbi:MAG TPA: carboxyl transferase domain-containing protein [Gemmataceae bacterium]|nr:carboxyl transferase domain-containing protein [Gemmataceae bacterium]
MDPGSFEEIGPFAQHRQVNFGLAGKKIPADGVVAGAASVDGRLVHLASQNFTVLGGSAGELHSNKVADVMELALKSGSPFILVNDSGGPRVQEGIDSLSGYGRVLCTNVKLSGAGAANLADLRPLRRRRRLLPGPHRLHDPDAPGPNVHHRPSGH